MADLQAKLLLIDDDESIRWVLEMALKEAGYQLIVLPDTRLADEKIASEKPDVIICDIRMPGEDGLSFTHRIKQSYPQLPVILMTAHADLDTAVSAYDRGAFEYLPKPFDIDEVLLQVARAVESTQINPDRKPLNTKKGSLLIGASPVMQQVFRSVGRLARSEVTVLIQGESGTGKELVAKALHQNSTRKNREFVALNMAAIPSELIESELFGHEKGSFTGANERQIGRFEQAEGGTLFLDEIGDMPMTAQTRLLRVLAEGVFHRVGGRKTLKTDVRILTATHRDLNELVATGKFREDLLHRLNVVRIELPALRERYQDIALLAKHFLNKAAREMSVSPKRLQPELLAYLEKLEWPGNVRQLENLCRWFSVMASGINLTLNDLPKDFQNKQMIEEPWLEQFENWLATNLEAGNHQAIQNCQQEFEQVLLKKVLDYHQGHRQKTAECLGWGRNTVTRKLKLNEHNSGKDKD